MSTRKPLLEIKNLSVGFPAPNGLAKALDNLTLLIESQQSLGLVGESGSGKSLTVLSIMRLVPPNAIVRGRILFKGRDILKIKKETMRQLRGNRISIIYQNPMSALNPVLTIGKQIEEAIRTHRSVSRQMLKKEIWSLLTQVNLPDVSKVITRYPYEFSGGMLQRVLIAIALANKPNLLLADEPTTALDVTIQAQILSLLNHLKEKFQLSLLFITHNLALVKKICNKVAVIYAGRLMEMANTETLINNCRHPYTKSLINIVVSLEKESNSLRAIPGVIPSPVDTISGCRFHPRCSQKKEICSKIIPHLKTVAKDHYVACHLVQ